MNLAWYKRKLNHVQMQRHGQTLRRSRYPAWEEKKIGAVGVEYPKCKEACGNYICKTCMICYAEEKKLNKNGRTPDVKFWCEEHPWKITVQIL